MSGSDIVCLHKPKVSLNHQSAPLKCCFLMSLLVNSNMNAFSISEELDVTALVWGCDYVFTLQTTFVVLIAIKRQNWG